MNHRTLLAKLTSSIPFDASDDDNGLEVEMNDDQMEQETEENATARRRRQDLPTEHDIQIRNVGWTLEAQRIAAETITNLCSIDDDGMFVLIY